MWCNGEGRTMELKDEYWAIRLVANYNVFVNHGRSEPLSGVALRSGARDGLQDPPVANVNDDGCNDLSRGSHADLYGGGRVGTTTQSLT